MLKSRLKPEDTDRLVRPLARLGISPLDWTMLAVLPALAGFFMLYLHSLVWGLLFFVLAGAVDLVDGAVARTLNQVTTLGAYVDGVMDRYVEFLLYLGLMLYLGPRNFFGLPGYIWMMFLLFGALMTTFVRAYADHRGLVKDQVELKRMGGILERGERLVLLYFGMMLAVFWGVQWLQMVIVLVALLANLTALQRVLFAVKHGKR
ncbi:MAG: CDP-alcohol phosphatidyltransferase family protein [Methanotrichaceae archaeon]|nr:CDP-alcohol phosphatidyltransferase family protein [Methanotrichaceae archaeon]